MRLTRAEQEMLEGREGLARQKAMELLVMYGDALGAERFVDTNNVLVAGVFPYEEHEVIANGRDVDDVASEFLLDSSEKVVVDRVKAFTVSHMFDIDLDQWQVVGASEGVRNTVAQVQMYNKRIGVHLTGTCTPYQCGVVPVFREHCSWMESSAVAYANSVIGARTNINGMESAFASALTGKTPYWGLHLDENRLATTQVNVSLDLDNIMECNLLGYYTGGVVGLDIPVYTNVKGPLDMTMFMALCATGASSGSVVMFHVVGVTPEARTLEEATGNRKPKTIIHYGKEERRKTYERLNQARSRDVDIVAAGCPHYTLRQIERVARLLEGKKVHGNTLFLIFTARQIRAVADRTGYTDIITKAGAHLLVDGCPLHVNLPVSNSVATDSARADHYLPGVRGYDSIWFGTTEDCVQAAITGRWSGELK